MNQFNWLIFFYSLPSKPVAARMNVWRRLSKAGALHFKGSAYLLPGNDEHLETLTWLAQEIEDSGGMVDVVGVNRTQQMSDGDLRELFSRARSESYLSLAPDLESLERTIFQFDGPPAPGVNKKLAGRIRKLKARHREIAEVDFFNSGTGSGLLERLHDLESRLASLNSKGAGANGQTGKSKIAFHQTSNYQSRYWVTRPRPFVDRMASAWLISRFIDPEAQFGFVSGKDQTDSSQESVGFDLPGGEFSHVGDKCSFEVLIRAFGLKGKALGNLAKIVHQLDLGDGKYDPPQAKGVEEILRGIQKSAKDDREALEKGMAVFEMLYASFE